MMSSDKNPTRFVVRKAAAEEEPEDAGAINNPVVCELVYDELITSLSTDVAFQMHRWIKTGVYPSSELLVKSSRRDLYPELYENEEHVEQECRRLAVICPERKRRKTLEEQEEDKNNYYGSDYLKQSAAYVAEAKRVKEEENDDAVAAAAAGAAEASSSKSNCSTGSSVAEGVAKELDAVANENVAADSTPRVQTRGKQPPTSRGKQALGSGSRTAHVVAVNASASLQAKPYASPHATRSTTPPPAHFGKQPLTKVSQQQEQSLERSQSRSSSPKSISVTVLQQQQQQQQQQHLDIYGNHPLKEPKAAIDCHVCGRQVPTSKFAPHLDKCLGIGTTVRAAALAASGFIPGQQQGNYKR